MSPALLLALVPALFQGAQAPPALKPGVSLKGEITDQSPVVETPTLKKGYTDAPVLGETFRFQVPESGPWHLDLRSYFFDAYLVLRDGEGRLLAEDDDGLIGVHSRIVVKLEAGREYRVTACALHGERGGFELSLVSGRPPKLSPQAKAAADLADARARVKAMEAARGPESLEVASAWNSLARALLNMGRYEDAEPLFQGALAIREKVLGPENPLVAQSLNNLAELFRSQGRYPDAEPLHKRALAIYEQALGPEHPLVATSLNNLAATYQAQRRYGEAQPLYARALAIREKVLGPGHPDTAVALNNLAALYGDQGLYDKARPLYERALAVFQQALGPEHPLVATSLNNLAGIYQAQGRYEEARPLYERALATREKALGPEHPLVAVSLNSLALLYADQGRYQEAEPLLRRSLAIREKVLGPEHPDVAQSLDNLAALYHFQGGYQEAEGLYKRALAIREKVLGPEHPDVAESLDNLAVLYEARGRYQEAEPLQQRALAIRERVLGPEQPDVARTLNNLAVLYTDQRRYQEAEPLYERALAIKEKVLGPEHPSVATSLSNLASLFDEQGRYEKAEPLFKRALAVLERTRGPEHPRTAMALNNLAGVYCHQGRFQDAEPLYQRALQDLLRHLDTELPVMSEADRFQLLAVTPGPGRLLQNSIRPETGAAVDILDLCLDWKGKATRLQAAGLRLSRQTDTPDFRRRKGDIQALGKELSTLVFLPAAKRSSDHEEKVKQLRKNRLELERALNRDLGLEEVLATPTSKEIQAALPADAVLLDFYVGKGVFAWVLHREGEPELVSLGEAEPLRRAQAAFLRRSGVRGAAALTEEVPGPASVYAGLLWKPLAALVADARTVLVSPDGFLGELPFGILPDGEGGFLIEKHRFAYLSDATRIVGQDGPAADREGSVLAVGDVNYYQREETRFGLALALAAAHSRSRIGDTWPPLTATREEIEALRGLHDQALEWKSPFDQLDGKGATEEAVRAALPGHRYLHLATHGYFEPEGLPSMMADAGRQGPESIAEEKRAVGLLPGLLSGLVFAGVNGQPDPTRDDGYLSAEEIQYLDLSACDLAVLSACETALGSERAGEGLQSLRRGFAVAGARTVVSSLWKVDDRAAATLMRHFYENYWQKGMEKLEALHAARLRMLSQNRADSGGDARPSTWGAFILSGDWR